MSPVVDLSPRDSLVARDMAMSLLPGTLKTPVQVDMLADVLEIASKVSKNWSNVMMLNSLILSLSYFILSVLIQY